MQWYSLFLVIEKLLIGERQNEILRSIVHTGEIMKLFGLDRGVVVACDVGTLQELERLTELTSEVEGIVGYKIGFSLGLKYGLKNVTDIIKNFTDLPVIYDHQKAGTDIPKMGSVFAATCKEGGVKGVILFPQAGPETEEAFIDALLSEGLVPFIGGEMTHPKYLERDGGFILNEGPEKMYLHGASKGAEYFIVPGNKPKRIEYYSRLLKSKISKPKICMPGIGRQGGDIKSAFQATEGLPAYAIIGSGIYKAQDMRKAAIEYCNRALEAVDDA